jgi:hypothetical protein
MLNFIPPPNDRKKRSKDELDVEEGDQEVSIYRSYVPWVLFHFFRDCSGRDRMVVGFTTAYAISAITTKLVSSNPAHGRCTRYNIM